MPTFMTRAEQIAAAFREWCVSPDGPVVGNADETVVWEAWAAGVEWALEEVSENIYDRDVLSEDEKALYYKALDARGRRVTLEETREWHKVDTSYPAIMAWWREHSEKQDS